MSCCCFSLVKEEALKVDCFSVEKPKTKTAKPEFKQGLKATKVKQGETVSLGCQVKLAAKEKLPKVSWMKDGVAVEANDRINLQANADGSCSLTIANSLPTDAGVYTCVLTNDGGTVKSEAAVTVESKKLSIYIRAEIPQSFVGFFLQKVPLWKHRSSRKNSATWKWLRAMKLDFKPSYQENLSLQLSGKFHNCRMTAFQPFSPSIPVPLLGIKMEKPWTSPDELEWKKTKTPA